MSIKTLIKIKQDEIDELNARARELQPLLDWIKRRRILAHSELSKLVEKGA